MKWSPVLTILGVLVVGAVVSATPVASQAPPEPGRIVVLGVAGEPVGGAMVTVLRPATQQVAAVGAITPASSAQGPSPTEAILLRTATTAEGVVEDPLPRLRGLTLIVDHPAHLPFLGSYPNEAPPGVIRLQPGRTAKGVVRESEGGDTVAGARVCAFWRNPGAVGSFGPTERCVDSGDRGLFELAGLPAGSLQATAEASGFETDARTIEQSRRPSRVVFELVAKVESTDEAEVEAAAGEVRVELVGAAGEPIQNFTMWAFGVGQRASAPHAVEAADGSVSVPIHAYFAGETTIDVAFEADDYLRSALIRVAPVPGGEVDLGLVALDRGAVVQGRLFDAVGAEAVAGCLVELLLAGEGPAIQAARMTEQHLAISGTEGEYVIGGLEAGRYHLRVQCPGVPITDGFLVLGLNELADQGESWLHPGRRAAVRVEGLDGGTVRLLDRFREIASPIVEAPLQSPAQAGDGERGDDETSARAEFLAAPGTYRLQVADETGQLAVSQEITIEEGPADVQTMDLRLPMRTIRSVLVLDGRPVSGGTVRFGSVLDASRSSGKFGVVFQTAAGEIQRLFGFGAGPRRLSAEVAPDGSFVLEKAPADLLWMTWYPGDGSYVGRLWPADPLVQADLSGVRVTGQLFDETGAPAAGQVSLLGDLGRIVAYAEAGDDGRFELPPAPPGAYRLKADAGLSSTLMNRGSTGLTGSVTQDLLLGTDPPLHQLLRISEAAAGSVEVELQHSDGRPAGGAWLHLVNPSGDVVGTGLATEAGNFANRQVPAGEVSVVWNDVAACTGGVGLTVEEDRTARVRESLPMGRLLELRCRAADCAGEPLSFLSVTTASGAEIASHLTGAGEGVRFSDSGRLGLGCVTPGSYEVSFWAAGRRWGAEVNVSSIGPAEEPLVVNGREASP
ncbi:MAG: carboxypeptidase-like regulatory domain-containing protein [Acidobacteria bacterium]|nr:carboxypeptidase-like regulatory domain-containing protein [Acidobacteriota bacterium]